MIYEIAKYLFYVLSFEKIEVCQLSVKITQIYIALNLLICVLQMKKLNVVSVFKRDVFD